MPSNLIDILRDQGVVDNTQYDDSIRKSVEDRVAKAISDQENASDPKGGILPSQDPAAPPGLQDKIYRIWDPRQRINTERHLCIYQGGLNTNIVSIPVVGVSNNSLQWNIPVPSNIIVGPEWVVDLNITFTFTGIGFNGGQLLVMGKYDGLRDLPLHKCITSITNKLNNQTFTVTPSEYIDAVSRYINASDRNKYFSGTGSMPDQFFNYADFVSLGSNRNPLAFYGENAYNSTRGSLNYVVSANTNTNATVTVNIREPLLISPLMYGKDGDNHSGFPSLQNINLQIQLANLQRMWSHAYNPNAGPGNDTGTLTNVTAAITSANLLLTQITPSLSMNPVLFDKPYVFNYNSLTSYAAPPVTIAAGATAVLSSAQIQVNCIPSRIYIWARQQDADQGVYTSDVFGAIDNINFTWDNQNSLLSNATSNDLWRLSVKNGLQDTFPQWSTYTGSVLCLEMGSDIGLLENQAPGLVGKYQFSFRAAIRNPGLYPGSTNPVAINYVLYCLPVLPGSAVFQGTTCNIKEGLFSSPSEILEAQYTAPLLTKSDSDHSVMYGGSFLGNIWDAVKDAAKTVAKWALPVADVLTEKFAPNYNPIVKGLRGITGFAMPRKGAGMIGGMGGRQNIRGRGMDQLEYDGSDKMMLEYNGQNDQSTNQQMVDKYGRTVDSNEGRQFTGMSSVNFPEDYANSMFRNSAAEMAVMQKEAQQSYINSLKGGPPVRNGPMANSNNYDAYGVQVNQRPQYPYNQYTQGAPLNGESYNPHRKSNDAAGGCGDCVGTVPRNELRNRLMNPSGGNGMNFLNDINA